MSESEGTGELVQDPPAPQAFRDFLVETAPGSAQQVALDVTREMNVQYFAWPTITTRCYSETCDGGVRNCLPQPSKSMCQTVIDASWVLIAYYCRNCMKPVKHFALWMDVTRTNQTAGIVGTVLKIGEHPKFGDRLPNRLLDLFE